MTDVDNILRAEQEQAKLAAIVESTGDAIISKDLQGTITSWNRGAQDLLGYTALEMIGRPVTLLFPPDRMDEERIILDRLRAGESIRHYETVRRCKDGRDIAVSLTITPIRDKQGDILGASKIMRVITERKQVEEALRKSEQHLELLSNSVPALIFYLDIERRYVSVNEAFTTWFGVEKEHILGSTVREFVGEDAWTHIQRRLDRAYAGETVDYEDELPYQQGRRWVRPVYTPHRDASGRVIGVIVLVTDITERQQAEEALRQSEERWQLALMGTTDGIYEWDVAGHTVRLSSR